MSTTPLSYADITPPVVMVVVRQWSLISEKSLRFALSISRDVVAVHINAGEDKGEKLKRNWTRYIEDPVISDDSLARPRLVCVDSPFRRFFHPLFDTLEQIKAEYPNRTIAVIVPELVGRHWYEYLLHNQRTTALKAALLLRGGEGIAIINVPWYLKRD